MDSVLIIIYLSRVKLRNVFFLWSYIYIHTYIHKLYLSSDFSVAYKLVSPILITNFKSYSKNKAKKRKEKIHNII